MAKPFDTHGACSRGALPVPSCAFLLRLATDLKLRIGRPLAIQVISGAGGSGKQMRSDDFRLGSRAAVKMAYGIGQCAAGKASLLAVVWP